MFLARAACVDVHGHYEWRSAVGKTLSSDAYPQVLARVFLARADVAYSVRTAAVHVWKTVVVNTPRTTTEILPTLMGYLIEALGSPGAPKGSPGLWALFRNSRWLALLWQSAQLPTGAALMLR